MAKVCITTVVSSDGYEFFIPLFIYAAKKAYPSYDVKVFVRGKLRKDVKKILDSAPVRALQGWSVVEDMFTDVPTRHFTCNCMRFLIPRGQFKGYKYVWITDVDFIIFRHDPTHAKYFRGVMARTGMPFAIYGAPKSRPRRPKVYGSTGWRGKYQRVAAGQVFIEVKPWYNLTSPGRAVYKKTSKTGKPDGWDKHGFARYREYDEVMLCRILKRSGLPYPERKFRFLDGKLFVMSYRDVHLGDFKFRQSSMKRRTRRLMSKSSAKHFRRLYGEREWLELARVCSKSSNVKLMLKRARVYAKEKKK